MGLSVKKKKVIVIMEESVMNYLLLCYSFTIWLYNFILT